MKHARHVVLACCGLLLLSSAIFVAQDFQLKARVNEVQVPVSVRDDTGALVQGLKKEEFTVLESGVPQEILSFSTDPLPISAAIVVDTAVSGDQLRRFTMVAGTLMREFKATDEFAVYRYDHVVTKLSDYTSNPQNLEKSFDAIKEIADEKGEDGPSNTEIGNRPLRWILDRTQIGTNGAPDRPDRPSTPISPKTGQSTDTKPPEVSRVLHDAIFAAEVDLEKRPENRRKMILLVSSGDVTGENEHSQSETVTRLYRNGIQVYAVDPEHKVFNKMGMLTGYTRGTGGVVFDGQQIENMAIAFAQVIEQARDQYMIGYVSSNEPPNGRPVVRNIDVKIKGKKYRIVHRMNYVQYP